MEIIDKMRAYQPMDWEQDTRSGALQGSGHNIYRAAVRAAVRARRPRRACCTPSMINNYVKMGVIARPEGKKYGREQLAMLTMLVVLKQANSIEDVARLMNAENGAGVREVYAAFCGYLIDSLREFADTLAAAGASALNLAVGAAVGSLACEAMLTSANPERGEKEKRR